MTVKRTKRKFVKTRTPNLVKYLNTGEYYLLYKLSGKQIHTPLKTTDYKVAHNRRNEQMLLIEKQRQTANSKPSDSDRPVTMEDLFQDYLEQTAKDYRISESTKNGRRSAYKRVVKTFPSILKKRPNQLEITEVMTWFNELNTEGTNYLPPGAKIPQRGNSFTTVVHTKQFLSKVLDIAVSQGLASENLIRTHERIGYFKPMKKRSSKIWVPSKADLKAIVDHLSSYQNGVFSFSIQLIAFSGCRIGEARSLKWRHVNFDENRLEIPGSKTSTSNRIIHMSKSLLKILKKRADELAEAVSGDFAAFAELSVMPVYCCNKHLSRACSELGIRKITNHDLRHYFGTSCLEADVPVSTVAAWMGHSDGGALLLKTYAHLRDSHSKNVAATLEL